MKKIIIKEGKFKKLIKEGGYGNDDLSNLYDSMSEYLSELRSAIGEHYSMVSNMREKPNNYVVEIDSYLDEISEIMKEWKEELDFSMEEDDIV